MREGVEEEEGRDSMDSSPSSPQHPSSSSKILCNIFYYDGEGTGGGRERKQHSFTPNHQEK